MGYLENEHQQQNLLQDLVKLLWQDERLVIEGQLLKNKVIELALALDSGLLRLLLSSEGIRRHFFQDVDGVLVFDKIKFQRFVSNKAFLPDSYTAFKNKIGLTAEGSYLTDSKEVVLAWPYKDCVLEGGQTKEDAKRNEVFWNETLAPDQIDRLLAPKVLTNFKKYDKDGEHQVTRISRDNNLIVKGNNLLALHTLKKAYAGKAKLIYIDPPYNTGSDSFKYNDSFNHSTWLTFMKNRLEVARELLREDGVIFVQCDDNEQAYLKVLIDEVFGRENFVTSICVQMSYVSGEKMAHINKKPPKIKEFLHFFAKNKSKVEITPQYTNANIDKEYNKLILKEGEDYRTWKVVPLTKLFKEHKMTSEEEQEEFMIQNADLIFNRVRNKSELFLKTRNIEHLVPIETPTGLKKWAWHGREVIFLSQRLIKSHDGNITYQQALGDIWTDLPIVNLYLEGDVQLIGGKKPEKLISRIIEMTTKKGDLIIDYHIGTGTTCAGAHKLDRRYIGIEQLDYGKDDSVVRLQNVINNDQSGISEEVNWQGGGSFIYCELAKANQTFIDQIQEAENSEKLTAIWQTMQDKAFLSYRIDPKKIDIASIDFTTLSLDDQKRFLIEVMDKNMLYVPASEIDDVTYGISDEDKKLNRQFFGEL